MTLSLSTRVRQRKSSWARHRARLLMVEFAPGVARPMTNALQFLHSAHSTESVRPARLYTDRSAGHSARRGTRSRRANCCRCRRRTRARSVRGGNTDLVEMVGQDLITAVSDSVVASFLSGSRTANKGRGAEIGPAAVPMLADALKSPVANRRSDAAKALGKTGSAAEHALRVEATNQE